MSTPAAHPASPVEVPPRRPRGANRPHCEYCGSRDNITRDHILPKRTGAGWALPCGSRNYKWACLACNNVREHAQDCIAPVMIARQMAREASIKPRKMLIVMGYIGTRAQQALWRQKMLEGMAR